MTDETAKQNRLGPGEEGGETDTPITVDLGSELYDPQKSMGLGLIFRSKMKCCSWLKCLHRYINNQVLH